MQQSQTLKTSQMMSDDRNTKKNSFFFHFRPWALKFSSWNVNGVRAWLKVIAQLRLVRYDYH